MQRHRSSPTGDHLVPAQVHPSGLYQGKFVPLSRLSVSLSHFVCFFVSFRLSLCLISSASLSHFVCLFVIFRLPFCVILFHFVCLLWYFVCFFVVFCLFLCGILSASLYHFVYFLYHFFHFSSFLHLPLHLP